MQINRLFEIVYILLNKSRVTAKELAEHFEVSSRTIYRDIETLSGAGIPVYMSKGKGGGVSLLSEFILDKAIITESEKNEIVSSLQAINAVKAGEEAAALRKLGSLFGKSEETWIEVDFGAWSDGEKEAELFQNIKNAILEKRVVHFSYASAKGEITERAVEPLKLCFRGGAWYLYGYCRKRNDYRFFRLKRIRQFYFMEEIFLRECPTQVLKRQKMDKQMETVNLKLKIEKEAAYRVYDEFEDYERLDDGSFLTESKFPKNEWLFYYIMSFGRYVEVVEPEEIRNQLKDKLQEILDKYE